MLRGSRRSTFVACAVAVLVLAHQSIGAAEPLAETTRLAALGKVWGLLKYFHPQVAQGTVNWDETLIAAIAPVRSADTKPAFNDEIMRLIRAAGSAPRVQADAPIDLPESDRAFLWIDDETLFDRPTIDALKGVRHAVIAASNRYVTAVPNVGNPDFSREAPYDSPAYPGAERRLLALFRFWNMVQYYAPNRDVTDREWGDVLPALVPRFLDAGDAVAYHLAVCELTASINDAHSFTSSAALTNHWGTKVPAIRTRFIESQTVVTTVFERLVDGADVRPGDIVTDVDGVDAASIRARFRTYMWGSNEGSVERNIDSMILRTSSETVSLGISRFGVRKTVPLAALPLVTVSNEETAVEAAKAKWRVLDANIGYVHMGLLQQSDVTAMMNALSGTRAIIFDVRNYPNGTLYLIAQRLNPAARPFVSFSLPRYEAPGTMVGGVTLNAGPATPSSSYYRGRVIVLGDERTQSHAEFTMMALRTAPDVTVVGSPTAGADGNVSLIALPGGIRTYFSGLGVYYPDGTPTQRVGIVPDIFVFPTIDGIQRGADEVLERALALLQ